MKLVPDNNNEMDIEYWKEHSRLTDGTSDEMHKGEQSVSDNK